MDRMTDQELKDAWKKERTALNKCMRDKARIRRVEITVRDPVSYTDGECALYDTHAPQCILTINITFYNRHSVTKEFLIGNSKGEALICASNLLKDIGNMCNKFDSKEEET